MHMCSTIGDYTSGAVAIQTYCMLCSKKVAIVYVTIVIVFLYPIQQSEQKLIVQITYRKKIIGIVSTKRDLTHTL